jgi:hypothetical protein
MAVSIANIELSKFYSFWMQNIVATQQTDTEGSISEQIFTQEAMDLLADAGEVENYRTAYDEKALGTSKQHKINGYSISENYETVDLFITIFKGTEDISKTSTDEVDQAAKRVTNFFRKAIYSNDLETSKIFRNEYVDEIEESSEIFQFANTLGREKELRENLIRVNAVILTNGTYSADFPKGIEIAGYKIYFKVFDLLALFNVSEKAHLPIEIDFNKDNFKVPCIASPSLNSEYQSYLAIIPGVALAKIYEEWGARLLEQNVRSFLQVGTKKTTNYGIRKTILERPEMFLAYNNGLTTTADEIVFEKSDSSLIIKSLKDFQIVNGGQTTASIFHTMIKDKADLSQVFVQMKISVIKNKNSFSDIVSKISLYANTQNKTNNADFSSNKPYHIEFEKLSRSIYTPILADKPLQTRWFYERARGQYKNAGFSEGYTKSRKAAFELKNPKNQMLTKEDLSKYVNSYQEEYDGKKIVIGPHFVTHNTRNFNQFTLYKTNEKKLTNVYFEDTISKAILFKSCDKLYGIKPNSLGDLKFIVVPYTISYFGYKTNYQLDLYKVWKSQRISEKLATFLRELMIRINHFFVTKSPESLIYMWARKEECWQLLKNESFELDFDSLKSEFIDKKNPPKRNIISDDEGAIQQANDDLEKITSIPYSVWKKIEEFGYSTKLLSDQQCTIAFTIAGRLRTNGKISVYEKDTGLKILDTILVNAPELLFDSDEVEVPKDVDKLNGPEITMELIEKMIAWDKKNRKLKPHYFRMMTNISKGSQELNAQNIKYCLLNYNLITRHGFKG